ncbi:hypothetical protein [Salipaludibacillus neizhouensis]|uniref:hypothetical protein n=1 Tax=Salipaludibacillus neizhouensis TaxID=885475 RepID=UPI0011C395A0|nr:hypothetical protein [Salipaludibacillus neizhouensis]
MSAQESDYDLLFIQDFIGQANTIRSCLSPDCMNGNIGTLIGKWGSASWIPPSTPTSFMKYRNSMMFPPSLTLIQGVPNSSPIRKWRSI